MHSEATLKDKIGTIWKQAWENGQKLTNRWMKHISLSQFSWKKLMNNKDEEWWDWEEDVGGEWKVNLKQITKILFWWELLWAFKRCP